MLEEKIEEIIKNLPSDRKDYSYSPSIDKIFKLLRDFPYYKKLKYFYPKNAESLFRTFLNLSTFEIYPPRQILWSFNQPVKGVYLIISGEVKIFKPPPDIPSNNKSIYKRIKIFRERKKKYSNSYPKISNNKNSIKKNHSCLNIGTNLIDKEENKKNNIKLERIEKKGYLLGEEFMLYDIKYNEYDAKIGNKKCILSFLNSEYYHTLFDKINFVENSDLIAFLTNLGYFINNSYYIRRIRQNCEIQVFYKGDIIYNQNDTLTKLYLIKKGTVMLRFKNYKLVKSKFNQELLVNNADKTYTERFVSERKFELTGKYNKEKDYRLVNFCEGGILGFMEYYQKHKKYFCSAICLTDCELLEIRIDKYKQLDISDYVEGLLDKIKQDIHYLDERIKHINYTNFVKNTDYLSNQNKFMKRCLMVHPLSKNEDDYKYINCFVDPFPIKIKSNPNILKNTKLNFPLAKINGNNTKNNRKKINNTNNIKNFEKEEKISEIYINTCLVSGYNKKQKETDNYICKTLGNESKSNEVYMNFPQNNFDKINRRNSYKIDKRFFILKNKCTVNNSRNDKLRLNINNIQNSTKNKIDKNTILISSRNYTNSTTEGTSKRFSVNNICEYLKLPDQKYLNKCTINPEEINNEMSLLNKKLTKIENKKRKKRIEKIDIKNNQLIFDGYKVSIYSNKNK